MKKFIAVLLTGAMTFSLAACGSTEEKTAETETVAADTVEADAETAEAETTETEDAAEQETAAAEETETEEAAAGEKSEGVMTYDEYVAAELETEVVVETYVQAKQSWWEEDGQGKATFYTQDEDGAYFIYNMPCKQEEYDKLTQVTKIKVTGYKSEWSG